MGQMVCCERCFRFNHLTKDCFALYDIGGNLLPVQRERDDSTEDSDSDYLGSDDEDGDFFDRQKLEAAVKFIKAKL